MSEPKQALSLFVLLYFKQKNSCDVLPFMMHKVTFASPLTFHIVCVYERARTKIAEAAVCCGKGGDDDDECATASK